MSLLSNILCVEDTSQTYLDLISENWVGLCEVVIVAEQKGRIYISSFF